MPYTNEEEDVVGMEGEVVEDASKIFEVVEGEGVVATTTGLLEAVLEEDSGNEGIRCCWWFFRSRKKRKRTSFGSPNEL